jgi:DNA repair exonuclease SbcCD ATPase subunit
LQVEVTQLEDADSKIKAEKYAELVIKHLNKVLADLSRRSLEQQLGQLRTAADEARRKVQVAEIKVEELSMRLRNLSGALPEASLHELVSDLTKQQQALEVELAGMTGRREALQREVAKSSERLKKSSADNDVVRNLKRVVELRKEQLAQVKELYRQGVAGGGPGMVAKAEEQVVLAEIELAQAIQATARPTDAHLEKLNDELSQVAVSIAENEAKLPFLKDRLKEYEGTLAAAAQTKALREQLDYEIRELSSARLSADAAKRNVAELESSFRPARVEVFELTPKDEKGVDTDKVKRQ